MSLPPPTTASSNGNGNGPKMKSKRSFTGHHTLLPSSSPPTRASSFFSSSLSFSSSLVIVPLTWTFGRGSVIWRIWPAVILHTLFAGLVVFLKEQRGWGHLGIPNVMLTVLGVVIGFVISYRAMSGYDRYWMGRTAWTDVIRNARTTARLIWVHVPPRMSSKPAEDQGKREKEIRQVMAEKRMALDLTEGFAVALKHYLRGETGIYYDDLYGLVRPLHDHERHEHQEQEGQANASATGVQIASSSTHTNTQEHEHEHEERDPFIPAINSYGTFLRRATSSSSFSSHSSHSSVPNYLLPAEAPPSDARTRVAKNLIPFAAVWDGFVGWLKRLGRRRDETATKAPSHPSLPTKHRLQPKQNLPWEILRCLSEWISVLEERGTAPGALLGAVAGMEDALGTVEKILSTPLPFVYSVHIRHTVWLYLFFLPFQLVNDFRFYTIPGVSIAAFIYLGFLAAGEEIEQPFGYDENDLELDMYCRDIIHVDIENLKKSVCLNAPAIGHGHGHGHGPFV
ncbi:hypothetical protein V5O48_008951 [Marasmius crinis-equi]|uniref:Uncharacterized protein n=1 Tax=Marasmius crinis-equi TaxID=585013 RepID=A0ABR3FCI7_9AGAR